MKKLNIIVVAGAWMALAAGCSSSPQARDNGDAAGARDAVALMQGQDLDTVAQAADTVVAVADPAPTNAKATAKKPSVVKKVEKAVGQEVKKVERAAKTVAQGPAVTVLAPGQELPAKATKPVIVDFNATWCGPCHRFAPVFEAVADKYRAKAFFYSVDVDKHPQLAQQFGVQSIPMIAFIMPDGTIRAASGAMPQPEFDALVAKAVK